MYVPRSFEKKSSLRTFRMYNYYLQRRWFFVERGRGAGIIADLVFHRPRGQAVEYIYAFTIRSRAWTSNMLDKV